MRIAYGVHGYSRGHATRALPMLEALSREHELSLFAGGDAEELLRKRFPVRSIPCLGFVYERGQRSNRKTLASNWPKLIDLATHGPVVRAVRAELEAFRPDAVISDAEPWTHRAAASLGVPRIGFDHFGVLVHCRVRLPLLDWCKGLLDRLTYRWLTQAPERVLISSFFDAPPGRRGVRVVGPILREQLLGAEPTSGEHLLAYFNQGSGQLSAAVLDALAAAGPEIRLYGAARACSRGRLRLSPAGLDSFIEDLKTCRAVISTAGNQLVGEAMALGKPLLVLPEATVEQRLNAREIVRLGVGEQLPLSALTAEAIAGFLERAPAYAARCRERARDGRGEALEILQRWLLELAPRAPVPALREVAA